MTGPEVHVHLTIGCEVYDVGTITADPEHWREGLAGLLREIASEVSGEVEGEQCPADG